MYFNIYIHGVDLPSGNIADIQASYKYLDIPNSHGSQDKEERKI